MQEDLDNLLDESIRKRMKFSSASSTVMALVEQEKEVGQQPGAQTDKKAGRISESKDDWKMLIMISCKNVNIVPGCTKEVISNSS